MICNSCNKTFDEPDTRETSYESYYGVGGEFNSRTRLTLNVCPFCGDDDLEEEPETDEDED